jgi:hypothetical protein
MRAGQEWQFAFLGGRIEPCLLERCYQASLKKRDSQMLLQKHGHSSFLSNGYHAVSLGKVKKLRNPEADSRKLTHTIPRLSLCPAQFLKTAAFLRSGSEYQRNSKR